MTNQELDAMLACILLDAYRQDMELNEYKVVTEVFTPSKQYQRQMAMMLADPLKWMKRKKLLVWKRKLQNTVAVFLIVLISLGSIMAISPSIRAIVVRWIEEWTTTDVIFRFTGKDSIEEMPRYQITSLPDGYVENENTKVEWPGYVQHIYENEEGYRIYFDYMEMSDDNLSSIDIRDSTILPVTVNGYNGYLIISDNPDEIGSSLTWFHPEANLQFTIDAMLSQAEILHIAEGVSLVKK